MGNYWFILALLIEVAASELGAGDRDAAVVTVPKEDGTLDWADHERRILAVVNHDLQKSSQFKLYQGSISSCS